MPDLPLFDDLALERHGFVSVLEIRRPPFNYFSPELLAHLVQAAQALDADTGCRAIVLAAAGKVFCAGADFGDDGGGFDGERLRSLYAEAVRLFEVRKPLVAAVQGAAIGGGMGLALAADFRVTSAAGRFSANFAQLGLHCGFGISVTLPRVVGAQAAARLLYTGRRIGGHQAHAMGLADECVEPGREREAAIALATEIAQSAPLAVQDMRATQRAGLAGAVREVLERELACQIMHLRSADFLEGLRAARERRPPRFEGR